MQMPSIAVLTQIAPRFGEVEFDDEGNPVSIEFTSDEVAAILAAIATIEDEVQSAHERATASELGVLDRYVCAYITSGQSPSDAFRSSLLAMKTRSDILDKRIGKRVTEPKPAPKPSPKVEDIQTPLAGSSEPPQNSGGE